MINTYEYLANQQIMQYIDTLTLRTLFARITILNMQERPIETIEGYTVSGSININAASAMRRTGNLTLAITDADIYKQNNLLLQYITNINNLISINKRVEIEIGLKNTGLLYPQYETFWIPLGQFIITNASITHNLQGVQIALKLTDKMALLNGEVGGTLPTALIHSPLQNEQGKLEPVKFYTLIRELVTEVGGIPESKVIIENIPDRIANIVRWTPPHIKDSDQYPQLISYINPYGQKQYELYNKNTIYPIDAIIYEYGEAVGYQNTDHVFPGGTASDLSSNFGETVVSVLDKIKNTLGNYEYYFDIDGYFHFREIKNFLNDGSAIDDLTLAIADKYFINTSANKSLYSFTKDTNLISSYSNAPQYNVIKNDYTIWGKESNSDVALRYHLVIDTKELTDIQKQTAKNSQYYPVHIDEKVIRYYNTLEAAEKALNNLLKKSSQTISAVSFAEIFEQLDWRTQRYLYYIASQDNTLIGKELIENWPLVYHISATSIEDNYWHSNNPIDLKYYFDMIDINDIKNNSQISTSGAQALNTAFAFSVDNIGRRVKTLQDNKVNCIFTNSTLEKEILILQNNEDEKQECIQNGQSYIEVPQEVYDNLSIGAYYISAYDLLRSQLHEFLSYNENINLTIIPVYHLDVNTRITVEDDKSDIHGDYLIQSIQIPLTINGQMMINAKRAIERI